MCTCIQFGEFVQHSIFDVKHFTLIGIEIRLYLKLTSHFNCLTLNFVFEIWKTLTIELMNSLVLILCSWSDHLDNGLSTNFFIKNYLLVGLVSNNKNL